MRWVSIIMLVGAPCRMVSSRDSNEKNGDDIKNEPTPGGKLHDVLNSITSPPMPRTCCCRFNSVDRFETFVVYFAVARSSSENGIVWPAASTNKNENKIEGRSRSYEETCGRNAARMKEGKRWEYTVTLTMARRFNDWHLKTRLIGCDFLGIVMRSNKNNWLNETEPAEVIEVLFWTWKINESVMLSMWHDTAVLESCTATFPKTSWTCKTANSPQASAINTSENVVHAQIRREGTPGRTAKSVWRPNRTDTGENRGWYMLIL